MAEVNLTLEEYNDLIGFKFQMQSGKIYTFERDCCNRQLDFSFYFKDEVFEKAEAINQDLVNSLKEKDKKIEELKIQLQNNYGSYHQEIQNLQNSLDDIKNMSIFGFLKLKRK